jgi:hypothetical protein
MAESVKQGPQVCSFAGKEGLTMTRALKKQGLVIAISVVAITALLLIMDRYGLAWRTSGQDLEDNEAAIYFTVSSSGEGTLTVTIEPEEASFDGARWSAAGAGWQESKTELSLEAGHHTVTFHEIDGWDEPGDLEDVLVNSGETTRLSAAYVPWYGDINGTGSIDVADAILVLRQIVGLTDITGDYGEGAILRADVSGDGNVDVSDAILILRYIVALVTEFPVQR